MDVSQDPAIYSNVKRDRDVASMFLMTDYHHGMIVPSIFATYDTEGVFVTNWSLKYDPDGMWLFQLTIQAFWGNRTGLSPFSLNGEMIDTSEPSFKVAYRF